MEHQEKEAPQGVTDHVMTEHEIKLMGLEREEVTLIAAIDTMKEYGVEVPAEMTERLRDIRVQRGFANYMATLTDPDERMEALERAKVEGVPDHCYAPLTPPGDFFVEGNGTKQ